MTPLNYQHTALTERLQLRRERPAELSVGSSVV